MTANKRITSIAGLLLASFFWGMEFVVEKDVLAFVDANYSNTIRFFIASLICTIYFRDRFKDLKSHEMKYGLITGLFMGLGFAFQTMGLQTINVAENAILSSAYILIIPFLEWIYIKKNPGLRVFLFATIAIHGIFLIAYDGSDILWSFSAGEILTLCGSIFYAIGIMTINLYSKKTDPGMLTLMQFYVTTVVSVLFAIVLEQPPSLWTLRLSLEFIYLILFATIGAQLLMNFCIKYVTSSAAGIIFSTESVFAAILGILFLKEAGSIFLWTGMALIIGTNILYQAEFPRIPDQGPSDVGSDDQGCIHYISETGNQ